MHKQLTPTAINRFSASAADVRAAPTPTTVPRPAAISSHATDASGSDASPSGREASLTKVPISELSRPHPKAMQTLNRSTTKTGLARLLGESLQGCSFTIIGDDTALNTAVAKALAAKLGWFATSTSAILSGMAKSTAGTAGSTTTALPKGDALVEAEASVLKGLRSQRRVVVATVAGGAASVHTSYRDLYGSIIVRVDEDDKYAPKAKTPERVCHAAEAEVSLLVKISKGFGSAPLVTPTDKAQGHVAVLLKQLATLLQNKPDLVQKKLDYGSRGFRGDWPVVQPAEWNPVLASLERKAPPDALEAAPPQGVLA